MTAEGRTAESLVTRERHGRVLLITMCRENKRNAVDRPLADALDDALNELDDSPDLWVGVLAGGSRVFCAGSDLTSRGDYITERGGEYGIIRRVRKKPLIAAVEGAAYGGGLEMLFACDLVVAASTASFALPEVARGLVPTCGALFRGPAHRPLNLARQLVLTGKPLTASRLYNAGFVNEMTEPGGALGAALSLAQTICENAPIAVQASAHAISEALGADDPTGWTATERAQRTIAATEDMREGVAAFFERRPPVWRGR